MTQRTAPFLMASTLAVAFAVSGVARAEGLVVPKKEAAGASEAAAPPPPADWMNYNARPLTYSKGMFSIHGDLISDLSTNHGGKPVWITPNVFYGVSDSLSIGVAENPTAEFFPIGGGICLGSSDYCGHIFNTLGPMLLLDLSRNADMDVALHVGANLAFDPFVAGARAGVLMKFIINSSFALLADPSISTGLNHRDSPANKEFIGVPLRLGYQINPQLNAGLATGVSGYLSGFADTYQIPVGLGLLLSPNDHLDAGLNFTFANLAGNNGGVDFRTIALTVNYRMM